VGADSGSATAIGSATLRAPYFDFFLPQHTVLMRCSQQKFFTGWPFSDFYGIKTT